MDEIEHNRAEAAMETSVGSGMTNETPGIDSMGRVMARGRNGATGSVNG